jgi:hypothetical protein
VGCTTRRCSSEAVLTARSPRVRHLGADLSVSVREARPAYLSPFTLHTTRHHAHEQFHQGSISALNRRRHVTRGASQLPALKPDGSFVSLVQARTAPCDYWAQIYCEGKTEMDWRRFWGFMIFGAVYVGVFQYFVRAPRVMVPVPITCVPPPCFNAGHRFVACGCGLLPTDPSHAHPVTAVRMRFRILAAPRR